MPESCLRSHYPKSRAKPSHTAYSAAEFTSHLRVEYNNCNKPGQETFYPKSRAKPSHTAYSTAGFTSHLRVEYNNYNKPGQETILCQQSEFTSTCTESQYIQVIPILNSGYSSH